MDAPSPDSDARPGHPAWRKAWRGFLTFLEIIGLKDESREVDQAAQLARFKLYHTEFRKLLTANNSFLETLAEMDERRTGRGFVDQAYVQRKVVRAVADAHAMVDGLQVVSGGRYPALRDALGRITAELDALCQGDACGGPAALVLDAGDIRASHADLVGGKMSNLGELRNALGLPTPDGFAVTTEAYRLLVEQGGLRSWIQTEHMALDSADAIDGVSAELFEGIRATALPEPLQAALDQALSRLTERMGGPVHLAVRSSALGEDSALSFAGQFKSLLNVAPAELPEAYREVVASLYTPEAIHYRLLHGVAGDSAEMAVGVIAMQDATASGVVFSRDPSAPDAGEVLIQSVHGLGVSLVDGRTSPEVIRVAREGDPPRLTRTASRQASRFVALPGAGIKEDTLDPAAAAIPCITDAEALQLARWALELEAHFGCPQDIEWAVTPSAASCCCSPGPCAVLRRPRARRPEPGSTLLLEGGEIACPGVGSGPAVHLDADADVEAFPAGGVLVARRSSPSFVRVMTRARAIVTDAGSTTGHMASLARELRVPTLLNTDTATRAISAGEIVTVDAGNRHVYAGEVRPLIERQSAVAEVEPGHSERRRTPEILFLARALEQIAPLNLTDPRAPTFTAENCRTLHDLARFIHEKSYEEMFGLGTEMGDLRAASYQLDVFLPIDLFIIDLGGGVKAAPKGQQGEAGARRLGADDGGAGGHARHAHPALRPAADRRPRSALGDDAPRHDHPRGGGVVPGPLLRPGVGLLRQLLGAGGLPLQRARRLLLPHAEQELHRPALPRRGGRPAAPRPPHARHRRHPEAPRVRDPAQRGHRHRPAEQGHARGDPHAARDDRPPAAVLPADGCGHGLGRPHADDPGGVPLGGLRHDGRGRARCGAGPRHRTPEEEGGSDGFAVRDLFVDQLAFVGVFDGGGQGVDRAGLEQDLDRAVAQGERAGCRRPCCRSA